MELDFAGGKDPLSSGRDWLQAHQDGVLGNVFHPDADGASSGALAARAFERLRRQVPVPFAPGKGENVHTGAFRESLRNADLDAFMVFDMGSRSGAQATDLIAFLKQHGDEIESQDFARGHRQATGGILTPSEFVSLLRSMGFAA